MTILTYRKITSFEIKRRTFEGKNDNSLTSEYMPSYKYWLRIVFDDGFPVENTFRTKREALEYVGEIKRKEGQIM